MTSPPHDPFAPRATEELLAALGWMTRDGRAEAARRLLVEATAAAERIVARPGLARVMPALAPVRYRFWALRGFPCLGQRHRTELGPRQAGPREERQAAARFWRVARSDRKP